MPAELTGVRRQYFFARYKGTKYKRWRCAEPETKRKKAALAALVFEDWNSPTSSQRTVPVKRLKHIEAVGTR